MLRPIGPRFVCSEAVVVVLEIVEVGRVVGVEHVVREEIITMVAVTFPVVVAHVIEALIKVVVIVAPAVTVVVEVLDLRLLIVQLVEVEAMAVSSVTTMAKITAVVIQLVETEVTTVGEAVTGVSENGGMTVGTDTMGEITVEAISMTITVSETVMHFLIFKL